MRRQLQRETAQVLRCRGLGRRVSRHAHARRWTNRQSGLSAVRDETAQVLIVAEALHATAAEDVGRLLAIMHDALEAAWGNPPVSALLRADAPRFSFG